MGPGKGESHWKGDRIPPTWPCRPHVTNRYACWSQTTTLAVASDSAFSADAESERVGSNADPSILRRKLLRLHNTPGKTAGRLRQKSTYKVVSNTAVKFDKCRLSPENGTLEKERLRPTD